MQAYVSPTDPLVAELVDRLDAMPSARISRNGPGLCNLMANCPAVMPSAWRCSICCVGIHRYCPASLSCRSNWMAAREWLLTTDLPYARRYVTDVGGNEIAVRQLADVLLTQYGGIAVLTTLG